MKRYEVSCLLLLLLVCSVAGAQTVSETKMLADFEKDGGVFGNVESVAASQNLQGKSATIKKGVTLTAMKPQVDWLKYDLLRFEVYNPYPKPLRISLGFVDDSAPHNYFSWINRYISVRPGKSTVELCIPGLRRGEGGLKDSMDPRPFHWDKLVRMWILNDGEPIEIDNVRLERIDFPRDPAVRAFDFGPAGSPVILGTTGVTEADKYDEKIGHGWSNDSRFLASERRPRPADSFLADFISPSEGTFSVKVANGKYHVWLTWYDSTVWDMFQNFKKRSIEAEGKLVIEETMNGSQFLDQYFHFAETEDLPGDDIYARYIGFKAKPVEFDVDVADGRLDLTFRGEGRMPATVNGVILYPVDKAETGRKFLEAFNAWRRHEFDVSWAEQVPARGTVAADVAEKHGKSGYLVFQRPLSQAVQWFDAPAAGEIVEEGAELSLAMCRNERESLRVSLHAIRDLGEVKLSLSEFKNAGGAALPKDALTLEVVRQKFKVAGFNAGGLYSSVPWLLIQTDKTTLPKAGVTRSLYITAATTADTPEGFYKGKLTIEAAGKKRDLDLRVFVAPVTLPEPDMGLGLFAVGSTMPIYPYYPENEQRLKEDRLRSAKFGRLFGLSYREIDGPAFIGFKDGKAQFDWSLVKSAYEEARKMGFTHVDVQNGPAYSFAQQLMKDKGDLAKKHGFESPEAMAKAFFGPLAEEAKAHGLPVPLWSCGDEPTDTAVGPLLEMYRRAQAAGGRTTICWSPTGEPTQAMLDCTSVCNLNVTTMAHMERARKAGNIVYLNNQGSSRWAFGLYIWKAHQSGVAAYEQFTWNYPHSDPYYPLDSHEDDLGFAFADRNGENRPTWRLVNIREGIDDYRYTLALTQAIEKAQKGSPQMQKMAADAKAYLEGVIGKIKFESTLPDRGELMTWRQLDQYRTKVREFLLDLTGTVGE